MDLVVQLARARTHTKEPSYKLFKLRKTVVFLGLKCLFSGLSVEATYFGWWKVCAKVAVCEQKLLKRVQRSRQPWILLFSLETLICNRSPLPLRLSNLRNYLILLATLDLGTFLLLSH